ncbi:MAG: hypothetical protein ACM30G_01500 [Micromonosporaceae bacterium]
MTTTDVPLLETYGEPVPGQTTEWFRPIPPAPARLALGLTALADERVRPSRGAGETLALTVGLVGRAADGTLALARRVGVSPLRTASRGAAEALRLPGLRRLRGPADRTRTRVSDAAAQARGRGVATVAAGRREAVIFIQSTMDDLLLWAQTQAVPRIVDGLVPQLVDDVVPKILDGVLPEIRARVLPAVIEDLAAEPRIRELIMEQSRTAVGDATQQLRTSTASADDRVESAFRRFFPGPQASE